MADQGLTRPNWFEFALLKLSLLGIVRSSDLHFILKHLVNMFIPLSILYLEAYLESFKLSHFTFLFALESYLFFQFVLLVTFIHSFIRHLTSCYQ